MSGETKEVFGSNYGQNDVIINGLIEKMTLFDDNLMSLIRAEYRDNGVTASRNNGA